MAVKDFDPDCGDSAYTMGIVDLLLECVELSYRPGKMAFTWGDKEIFIWRQKFFYYSIVFKIMDSEK